MLQTLIIGLNGGILALLFSEKVRLPGLIFYLIFGVLLGPYFLNLVQPDSLGTFLPIIIELGVALIMFEGAMQLNLHQYKTASKAIHNLLSFGLVISVIAIMLMTKWLFGWPWGISLLFGILMSVTGPTVIAPILRKVPLKQPIGSILHWESILLEPIIVIGAILVVEFLVHTEITVFDSLGRLFKIIIVGGAIGTTLGFLITFIMKRYPPKHEGFRNIAVLGLALLIFEASNKVIPDSGLVAVVFGGVILGNSSIPAIHEIKQFKETITRVIISFLFILLSAHLNWDLLTNFSIPVIFLLIMVMFIIRPLVVFVSLAGSGLSKNSKVFLSLIAPRGIVAASMASLLTIVFSRQGSPQVAQFEILAYQVIFVTVFLQSLWSIPLSRILKVREKDKRGYLIVGAHPLGSGIAGWMKNIGVEAVLVDTDSYDVYLARKKGLIAHKGDALSEYFIQELPLQNIGNLLALTSNDEVNTLACQLGKRFFGQEKTFQIHKTLKEKDERFLKTAGGQVVFPTLPSLLSVLEEIGKGELIFRERKGPPKEGFIPLFEKMPNGTIRPITEEMTFTDNSEIFGLE